MIALRRIAVLATLGFAGVCEAAEKLNVLFLMVDDLRPELACYGQEAVRTPNIDALAKAGVRFERCYCQYPLCNPSRTSMLTGHYPTETGVLENSTYFRAAHPDFVTLPQHFQTNGYVTLRTGKIFHGGIDDPDYWTEGGEQRRFQGAQRPAKKQDRSQSDRIVSLDGDGDAHGDYKAADLAITLLNKYKDKPFLLCCGFTKPHSPPTAPARFHDMYRGAEVKLPVDFQPRPAAPVGFPKISVPARNGDLFIEREAMPEAAREMIRAYWASLTWTDWNVGRVLAELDRLRLREKTVIAFWGDHGYHLGEKGKWSKHQSLFEVGTRVPMIISAPNAKGNGQSSPRIVQSLDIYPTLADLCGLEAPAGLAGHSLRPLLANPKSEWKYPSFTVAGNLRETAAALRTERWRYAEWNAGAEGAMLFDEHADPHELKNLADDPQHAATRAELSTLLRTLPGLKWGRGTAGR